MTGHASSSRQVAVAVLCDVLVGRRSLDASFQKHADQASRDNALTRHLCFGVLRWYWRLDAVLGQLLHKPLRAKDQDLRIVLLLGLYQLMYTRVPPHAAVWETVSLASRLDKPWAKGLVNATLRRFQRDHQRCVARIDEDEVAHYSHPRWLLDAFKRSWPQTWREVVTQNNQQAPMTLRINRLKTTAQRYLQELEQQGYEADLFPHCPVGITLRSPADPLKLPGFADGLVSVQDGAAQLAAAELDLQPGHRVLDACAAPGGKTMHILESEPRLKQLVAIDRDPARLASLESSLGRIQRPASPLCADASDTAQWWDGIAFDRILLDAPCSATGVIRRHPDIKTLRRADDISRLARLQRVLLDAMWPLLAPNGVLLYATCSTLDEENARQIAYFLQKHEDATERPIVANWGHAMSHGRQILPGEDTMDGFFYARLQKRAASDSGV